MTEQTKESTGPQGSYSWTQAARDASHWLEQWTRSRARDRHRAERAAAMEPDATTQGADATVQRN